MRAWGCEKLGLWELKAVRSWDCKREKFRNFDIEIYTI